MTKICLHHTIYVAYMYVPSVLRNFGHDAMCRVSDLRGPRESPPVIRDVVDCPNADAFMLLLDGIISRGDSKRVIRELESYQPSRTELPAISVALGALFSYEAGSSASPLAKMTATAKAFHHLDRALGERPSWSLALYLRGALETSVPAIVRKQLCRSGPPERDLHQAILLASAEPGESLVAAAAHVYLGRYCMKLRKKRRPTSISPWRRRSIPSAGYPSRATKRSASGNRAGNGSHQEA